MQIQLSHSERPTMTTVVSLVFDVTGRTPTLGIWDDHDFGPNNSDRTAEGRMESLATFQSMWANPSMEARTPGHLSPFSAWGHCLLHAG